jgi:CubicO group peptidase (beta-lactamase class C family)
MTTLMAATLVDEHRLAWDARAVDILPEFRLGGEASGSAATLADLFGHTSGVSDDVATLFVDAPSPRELVCSAAGLAVLAPPGQRFAYSNTMFAIGGYAAARAAGAALTDRALYRGYVRLMRERVFERVGMPRSTLDFERAAHGPDRALPHSYSPLAGDWVSSLDFDRFTLPIAPAGAVWSSAADMARYLVVQSRLGLNAEGERVVSAQALGETQRTRVAVPGVGGGGYGLGWGTLDGPGGTQLLHDGDTIGFTGRLALVPAEGWGAVILTNRGTNGLFLDAVMRRLTALLHGTQPLPSDADLLARDEASIAALDRAFAETDPVEPGVAAAHVGRYTRGIRLSLRGEELIVGTRYGELPFRAVPGTLATFSSVGPIQTQMLAELGTGNDGMPTVRLGYPDATGQLRRPVVAERTGPVQP